MTSLYYRDGSSDKVYHCNIQHAEDGYNVNFQYGRRGSTLVSGTKNSAPLTLEEAEKVYDKLVKEKMAKGYTPGLDGSAYTATTQEDRYTGVLPMLLNPIDEANLGQYMDNPHWLIEQKFDGVRMRLRRLTKDGPVEAINRKGLLVGAPEEIIKEAEQLPGPFLLDGEAVGTEYHCFDDESEMMLSLRKVALHELLSKTPRNHIHEVQSFYTQKWAFLDLMRERNAEGIVLKHLDGMYHTGRPGAGGPALKFKFTASCTCMVHSYSGGKRSIAINLQAANGDYVGVGFCTIPPNQEMPMVGSLVEIRYLYAFKGGCLFQPVYLGPRDDATIDKYDCLKFKAATEEDDEA